MVLRRNSGSGKSTVAHLVQTRFDRATCLIVSQDRVRREMLREGPDVHRGVNVELIEAIATWGLDREMIVIAEGIFAASRYQRIDFAETVRRHSQRPQRDEFSPAEMVEWYHGWQPLEFVEERRFTPSVTAVEAADVIEGAIRT